MAARLVTLDRVRGDCTVELGGATFTVPSAESCTEWLSRLNGELKSQFRSSALAFELDWANHPQRLTLRQEELLLCVALDVNAMALVSAARTPPLSGEWSHTLLTSAAYVIEQMVTEPAQAVASLDVLRPEAPAAVVGGMERCTLVASGADGCRVLL